MEHFCDGDHFVLQRGRQAVFRYSSAKRQQRLGTWQPGVDRRIDAIYVTPDNNVTLTLVAEEINTPNTGIELFD